MHWIAIRRASSSGGAPIFAARKMIVDEIIRLAMSPATGKRPSSASMPTPPMIGSGITRSISQASRSSSLRWRSRAAASGTPAEDKTPGRRTRRVRSRPGVNVAVSRVSARAATRWVIRNAAHRRIRYAAPAATSPAMTTPRMKSVRNSMIGPRSLEVVPESWHHAAHEFDGLIGSGPEQRVRDLGPRVPELSHGAGRRALAFAPGVARAIGVVARVVRLEVVRVVLVQRHALHAPGSGRAGNRHQSDDRPEPERGAEECAVMAAVVRAPVGELPRAVLEFVEVPAEMFPPLTDFLLYLVRVFAHCRFSFTVSTVFCGGSSTLLICPLPDIARTPPMRPAPTATASAAAHAGQIVARA